MFKVVLTFINFSGKYVKLLDRPGVSVQALVAIRSCLSFEKWNPRNARVTKKKGQWTCSFENKNKFDIYVKYKALEVVIYINNLKLLLFKLCLKVVNEKTLIEQFFYNYIKIIFRTQKQCLNN